jgi:hypothetical protein
MTDENKPSPEIASPDQESGEAEHYFALLDAAWETVVHYARVNVDEDIVMFNTAKNAIRALLASRPQHKEPQTEASGAKDARELADRIERDYMEADYYNFDNAGVTALIERYVESRIVAERERTHDYQENAEWYKAKAEAAEAKLADMQSVPSEASGELSFQVLRDDLEILMRNGDGQQRGIIQNAIECVDEIEALLAHEAPKDGSAEKTVPVPIAMLREISERVYGTAEILKCAARYGCTVTESGKEEPK